MIGLATEGQLLHFLQYCLQVALLPTSAGWPGYIFFSADFWHFGSFLNKMPGFAEPEAEKGYNRVAVIRNYWIESDFISV